MAETYDSSKKNVIIVGGGIAGFNAAKQLSAKLSSQYNIVLITQEPYFVYKIALIRLTVADVDDLLNKVFIPYDKLPGIVHKVGTVTSIEESGSGQGGNVILEGGEHLPYAALILATGSLWSGSSAIGITDKEIRQNVQDWRSKFGSAKHVVVVGGGAVGIETVGEIRDAYPDVKVTLVHSDSQLLSAMYPDKFRRSIEDKVRSRDIDIVFGDYIDEFPESGQTVDITTRRGQSIKGVDLVVPAFGTRPNTAFIESLGSGVLTETGTVKIKPTFELLHHSGIFAIGDIIEWKEAKQAAKAPKHATIATTNLISFLSGQPQTANYGGQPEMIVIPVGKKYGAGYLDLLWGIHLGNFLSSLLKGKTLFVSKARKDLGYQ
ncbi:FAD/NAD-P-binding domain-containing protein [Irpex rosettiformis]|uniref:FAD/NAD-P-binding domain-containing protein n=1 Tax=Irpex rosettiformis TaxID=378272 RepID=A0ACB8U2K2_9APHY|nr:FAD/NAD-P-binding domain-containing protein [Irpex rosettiformis]